MGADSLRAQLERIARDFGGAEFAGEIQLERPRNPEHGDLATNLALVLASALHEPPRLIATRIIERLDLEACGLAGADIAGPGFINFRLGKATLEARLRAVLERDDDYGRSNAEPSRKVLVEFVSANPTGPLHVAHGRGAALGDALASLLSWTGHGVSREFYINDAGTQIDKLVESLDARLRQRRGEDAPIPEGGYHGSYVADLAADAEQTLGTQIQAAPGEDPAARAARLHRLRDWAVERLLAEQKADLLAFGVTFDSFYAESGLYERGAIEQTLDELDGLGLIYESEGARWLRSTQFGDDKDRVLVKSDGTPTYLLPDIAYHRDKAKRGFDLAINIWGADHHGYIPRMQAALAGLGLKGFLEVEIVQLVRVMRAGKEVRLSKRAGEFVTLRELMDETGPDVARYFFLMRRGDAQMVFDLDLALDHSEKNPVYKVQYAHARMMSIFRKAGVAPHDIAAGYGDAALLREDAEQELIKRLAVFPEAVSRAAESRAPHLVCEYLEATASAVNSWYHAGNPSRNPALAVLVEDDDVRRARLLLAHAIQIVLRNGLGLLGLSAPDRMEREEQA